MRFIITKEEFLMSKCLDKLLTRENYNKKIEGYKKFNAIELESGEEYPNYDEYVEFYAEKGFNFCEYYNEQSKNLRKFEVWLNDNKDKTFTYDEINQKLLELKLSFDGFNGDFKIEDEQ